MKNKLLLSTALVGSLVASSITFAETKVTGNLEQTYSAVSFDKAGEKDHGGRALGAEVNIGLSSKKALSNGLQADYGFTIEDGTADTFYLRVGSEAIGLTIANDYGTNSSQTTIPFVSDTFETIFSDTVAGSGAGNKVVYNNHGANAHDKNHVAIGGKVNGTEYLVRYAPNNSSRNSDSDMCGSAAGTNCIGDIGGSATEIVVKGSLGVPGLGVMLAYETAEADHVAKNTAAAAEDKKFKKYGLSYNFGAASVGVTQHKYEDGTAGQEDKATQYGISGKLAKDLSAGIYYLTNDRNTGSQDEKIKMAQIGYNFGGIGIELSYGQAENANFTNGNDYEVMQIRTIQSF